MKKADVVSASIRDENGRILSVKNRRGASFFAKVTGGGMEIHDPDDEIVEVMWADAGQAKPFHAFEGTRQKKSLHGSLTRLMQGPLLFPYP